MIAVEARGLEAREGNARLGHETRFDAVRSAREAHIPSTIGENLRQSERGIDVPAVPPPERTASMTITSLDLCGISIRS